MNKDELICFIYWYFGGLFEEGNYCFDVEASCMETQIFFRVQRKTIVAEETENKECDNQKIQLALVFLSLSSVYW